MTAVKFLLEAMIECDCKIFFNYLSQIRTFPELSHDITSVEQRDQGNSLVSDWKINIRGHDFLWTQTDKFSDLRYEFELVSGDFESLVGSWCVVPTDSSSSSDAQLQWVGKVLVNIEFDLGIPALARTLHPIMEDSLKSNIQRVIQGIAIRSNKETPS